MKWTMVMMIWTNIPMIEGTTKDLEMSQWIALAQGIEVIAKRKIGIDHHDPIASQAGKDVNTDVDHQHLITWKWMWKHETQVSQDKVVAHRNLVERRVVQNDIVIETQVEPRTETVITIGNLPEALCMESSLRASQLLLGHILLPPPDIHPAARMLPRLLHRTLLPHLDMPLRDKPIQVPMEHNQWLLVLSPRTKPHLLLLVPFHHTRYLVQFLLPALHLHTHLHLGQPHPMRLLPLEQLRLMHHLLVLRLRTHLLHPFALRRLTNQVQSFLRLLLGLLTRLLGLSQVFTPPGMSWKAVQLAVLLLLLHMGQPRQVATPPQGTLPLALGMLLPLLVPHTRLLRFLELSVPTRLRLVRKSRRCLHLRDSAVRQTWRSRIRGSRR